MVVDPMYDLYDLSKRSYHLTICIAGGSSSARPRKRKQLYMHISVRATKIQSHRVSSDVESIQTPKLSMMLGQAYL